MRKSAYIIERGEKGKQLLENTVNNELDCPLTVKCEHSEQLPPVVYWIDSCIKCIELIVPLLSDGGILLNVRIPSSHSYDNTT